MKLFRICVLLFFLHFISGCTDALISAAATTGTMIAQERTVGKAVDDITIWAEIKHLYLQKNAQDLLAGVKIEVIEGRVHLTGVVETSETRIDAVRLAWQPEGVVEVINEVQVLKEKNLKDIAVDKWIKAQLKTKMVFTKEIKSINYTIDVVNGIVYLMGIAQDVTELDDVTSIASKIKGVQKVISHVRLKDDPNRA